jgi:hypothetical protein
MPHLSTPEQGFVGGSEGGPASLAMCADCCRRLYANSSHFFVSLRLGDYAEVNASPSLSADTPADLKLKSRMLDDTIHVVDGSHQQCNQGG